MLIVRMAWKKFLNYRVHFITANPKCPAVLFRHEADMKLLKKFNSYLHLTRAGHFRYFLIFSLVKNDFLHFLSS